MRTRKALTVGEIRDEALAWLDASSATMPKGTEIAQPDLILLVMDLEKGQDGFLYYLVPVVKPDGSIPAVVLLDANTGDFLEATTVDDTQDGLNAILIQSAQQIIGYLNEVGRAKIKEGEFPVQQVSMEPLLVWHHTRATPLPYFPLYQLHTALIVGIRVEWRTFYVPIAGLETIPGEIPDLSPYTSYPGTQA